MVVFAVSLLGVVGTFNVIDGIAAVARSHVFIASAHYVIGDLRTWGWVALILGVLQLLAMLGPGRQPGSPLVRGGSDRAQRNRGQTRSRHRINRRWRYGQEGEGRA